jgi:uncharacterized membrane protein
MTLPTGHPPAPPRVGLATTLVENAERLWRRADRYVRSKLLWNNLYRTTSYLRSALWIVPLLSILLVLALVPTLRWLDAWLGWRLAGLTVTGAQSLYQSVITLTLSFMVFTFGSLLVAIQIASGQLTPRIIATTLLRDNVVKYSVGLFTFTLIFAIMALNRLETSVHELVSVVVAVLGIACMATFLFLIDYAARLLRPVSILARVANDGLAVVKSVYPVLAGDLPDMGGTPATLPAGPPRIVRHVGTSEMVLAVDLATLIREARRSDGIIEFVPRVGDFVASEEPLFALYGGAAAVDDTKLRATVAFGSERTLEQDPLFAFRIMVDIGLKALSPAINDPTTAVLALDQIHRLLKAVGQRHLRGETIVDRRGRIRVIFRTPNWEDFVHLSCHEIRMCGANNVQIARRMRAMLDDLTGSLPARRRPPLEQEGRQLAQTIEPLYRLPGDLALAQTPDSQGLGGSSRHHPTLGGDGTVTRS